MSLAAIWSLAQGVLKFRDVAYIAVIAVLFGLWQWAKADCAAERAAQAKAVIEAQQKAEALSNELVIEQAKAMATLDATLQPIKERIVRVPSTTVCRDSASVRAAIDGVRRALGAGQPETE